jgi:hypothetical protein
VTSVSRPAISRAGRDALIEEATVDSNNEQEQITGLFTMLEEHLALPFDTAVLGMTVTVAMVDLTVAHEIAAIVSPRRRIRTSSRSRSEIAPTGARAPRSNLAHPPTDPGTPARCPPPPGTNPRNLQQSPLGRRAEIPDRRDPHRCSAFSHRRRRIDRSNASWSVTDSARTRAMMPESRPSSHQARPQSGPARTIALTAWLPAST